MCCLRGGILGGGRTYVNPDIFLESIVAAWSEPTVTMLSIRATGVGFERTGSLLVVVMRIPILNRVLRGEESATVSRLIIDFVECSNMVGTELDLGSFLAEHMGHRRATRLDLTPTESCSTSHLLRP